MTQRSGGAELPQPVQYVTPGGDSESEVKGPLPAEHQIIQDVLDRLRGRAIMTTQNMVRDILLRACPSSWPGG